MRTEPNRSCAKCGHWRMYSLKNFQEDDINDTPAHDGWGSPCSLLPFLNWVYLAGWLFNSARGAASVESKRAKLKKLRAEVLPRAPNTIVCPRCFETIERF